MKATIQSPNANRHFPNFCNVLLLNCRIEMYAHFLNLGKAFLWDSEGNISLLT